MSKASEKRARIARAREYLRDELKRKPELYTLTNYGRGERDYVRVFYVTKHNGIREITYLIAAAEGSKWNERGIARNGGNYSKALDVFIDVCRYANIEADQAKWRKL